MRRGPGCRNRSVASPALPRDQECGSWSWVTQRINELPLCSRRAARVRRIVLQPSSAGAAAIARAAGPLHRVEQHQCVVQLSLPGPGLLAPAGHVEHRWNSCQPTSSVVCVPSAIVPAFTSGLALNAKMRVQVVSQEPQAPTQEAKPAERDASCARHRPVRLCWAKLLKRVFEIDMEHSPNCGGELKIIAAILEQPVIKRILTHLSLQARAPPRAPARGRALQAAPRWQSRRFMRPGTSDRWIRLRPRARGTDGSGLATRDSAQAARARDDFRRRYQGSTVLRHLHSPARTRRGP